MPSGVSMLQHGLPMCHNLSVVRVPCLGGESSTQISLSPDSGAACFLPDCVWARAPLVPGYVLFSAQWLRFSTQSRHFPWLFCVPNSWLEAALADMKWFTVTPPAAHHLSPLQPVATIQVPHKATVASGAEMGCQLQRFSSFNRRSTS